MDTIAEVKLGIEGGYVVTTLSGHSVQVPNDVDNRDYAKVQAWQAAGGTITAADSAPTAPSLADAIADRRAGDPVIEALFSRLEAMET